MILDEAQAIKNAINNDAVLSKLLVAEDGPLYSLVVKSLIDGDQVETDLGVVLTAYTVTDAKALKILVEQARTQDFCIASEEHELGVQALSVPLRSLQGQTVAALNVVVAPHRMTLQTMQNQLLPVLQDAARELRALL